MKRLSLKVAARKILGSKKVRKLRREGILPANIYGKSFKSQAVQLPLAEFEKLLKEAGETQVIDLAVDSTTYPVLIHNVQYEPVTSAPLHADFYKVDLKEKIKAMVPVVATGEPKAVADKLGLLLQTLSEIEVEALPTDLPEKLEVDVSGLAELNQQITVADLKVPAGVQILAEESQIIFKIGGLVTKEVEELAKAEEEAAAAAKVEAAAEKGEAPTEEPAPEAGTPTPSPSGAEPSEKGKKKDVLR